MKKDKKESLQYKRADMFYNVVIVTILCLIAGMLWGIFFGDLDGNKTEIDASRYGVLSSIDLSKGRAEKTKRLLKEAFDDDKISVYGYATKNLGKV